MGNIQGAGDNPAGLGASDKTISQLTELTELDGTEMLPVIQGNDADGWNNYKVSAGMLGARLFIDQWNAAWGSYGKYDPVNAPDALHPFMGNEIWMSYEEALSVYGGPRITMNGAVKMSNLNIPTVITSCVSPFTSPDLSNFLFRSTGVRSIRIAGDDYQTGVTNFKNAFYYCSSLQYVLGIISLQYISSVKEQEGAFFKCNKLEDITLKSLKWDISFADSPLLSLDSLNYMVVNAANTTAITITVHPDVYAKITDEGNTGWHALLDAATAKNISFATV